MREIRGRSGRAILMGTAGEIEDQAKFLELWKNTGVGFIPKNTDKSFYTNYSMWLDFGKKEEASEGELMGNMI